MKKKSIVCAVVMALMLSIPAIAYAASVYTMTYLPGTTDAVTNLPAADAGTGGEAYTVSSQIPQREGYEFIDWTLDYGVIICKVTYVVNPDSKWGLPEGSSVPTDPTDYIPGDMVKVKDQLTTEVDYAYNSAGEKVKGTWKFETWDKDDFPIYEDTTITGGWVFTPAPAKTYTYTVHYKLYEGSVTNAKKVHADTYGEVSALGDIAEVDAIPVKSLDPKYKNTKKYKIRSGFDHVTVTITHDNYEITIWYEPVNSGR